MMALPVHFPVTSAPEKLSKIIPRRFSVLSDRLISPATKPHYIDHGIHSKVPAVSSGSDNSILVLFLDLLPILIRTSCSPTWICGSPTRICTLSNLET